MLGMMLLLWCASAAGQTNKIARDESPFSGTLSGAALQMYVNYSKALSTGQQKRTEEESEIPSKYWTDPIKELKPVRVYTHRVNIVVVQRIENGIEEGKYIYIPVSSYLPHSGVDGFEFIPNPQQGNRYSMPKDALEFKRTRRK